jgi:hypothetical protein
MCREGKGPVLNSAPHHMKLYVGVEVSFMHSQPQDYMEVSAQLYALVNLPQEKMTPLSIG